MKNLFLILLLWFSGYASFAQTDTNSTEQTDTLAEIKPSPVKPQRKRLAVDSTKRRKRLDSLALLVRAQKKDSAGLLIPDTNRKVVSSDSLPTLAKTVNLKKPIDSFYLKLLDNPFLRSKSPPIYLVLDQRKRTSMDEIFYLLSGLLLLLAFIKLVFSKYFANLFRLFFQPSFRQRQTREQLQQGNFPSLLLNLFFVISAAVYISFLMNYYQLTNTSFWLLLLYTSLSLIILYVGKFIFLNFAGWVFNVREATNAYIFAIYLINKITGIVLVPFIFLIAFAQYNIKNVSVTVSILIIFLLFLYRYLISYGPVKRDIKVTPVHFVFYVLAFEITPLLVIYKTITLYLNNSL